MFRYIKTVCCYYGLVVLLAACAHQAASPTTPMEPIPTGTTNADCATVDETLVLSNQTVRLPATGRFVVESHLATTSDPGTFPTTVTENIDQHLQRACHALSLIDNSVGPNCSAVYRASYMRQWTPPEGGKAGQGSVSTRPTALQEMFSGNMYWKGNIPPPGTRFLACYGVKCVVVAVGFETGPRDPKLLGGLQPEVFYFLKANDQSSIRWGRLKNQSLAYGPVECK